MRRTPLLSAKIDAAITVRQLKRHGKGWLLDIIRQLSETTLDNRYFLLRKLLWFLRHMEYDECGTMEIKEFLVYITNGHKEAEGRWDNPHLKKVRLRTVSTYFTNLRTFFRYLVADGVIDESPVESIRPPIPGKIRFSHSPESRSRICLRPQRRALSTGKIPSEQMWRSGWNVEARLMAKYEPERL